MAVDLEVGNGSPVMGSMASSPQSADADALRTRLQHDDTVVVQSNIIVSVFTLFDVSIFACRR